MRFGGVSDFVVVFLFSELINWQNSETDNKDRD